MAFPFIFESNFEQGTNAEWDSETDVEGVLNIRHYTWLAREDVSAVGAIAPWRGAYVAEWNLTGDTADHVLIEGDMDIADTATAYTRFMLFLGKDLSGVTDTFNIFELQGTGNAVESAIGLRITTGQAGVEIGVGKTAPTVFATSLLQKGKYYAIELKTTVQTGGTGTSDVYVDGALVASVTGVTNTAVLRGVLGVQDTLSTTVGHLYVDALVFDDTRVYPHSDRYPEVVLLTKSAHVALGQTDLLNVTLMQSAGVDNSVKVFDTDNANVTDASNIVAELYNLTANEPPIDLADVPAQCKRGAYVQLSGTSPRALVRIGCSQGYRSHGRVRQHGINRVAHNAPTQ
jgi:hypothetical protein